ncbi:response regulator transcription factor [Romboutsia sp. 1001713B170131_170501_G6]|uniref:response regulator transcription factor n=1 Tax=Romboutsia sp. 1001713B170131_170501_G6 TaxID=2787108 RepID=UPI0018AADCE1|nr:response regulator transcription factor [Romboutsia sp. 1001713B170131_170501_G6]
MRNILLLEDDEALNEGISFMLKKEGYNVFTSYNIKEAKTYFYSNKIDLIISDINLPDGDGLSFCEEIRKNSNVLILFLSALDQEFNIINGYNVGADDYITKPFSLMIFMAKVNSLIKRIKDNESSSQYIVCEDIKFNLKDIKIIKNNEEIVLTKNEYKLLKYMMENSMQILTKEQLLECIWEQDGQFVYDNAVAVNIKRLREKVENNTSSPIYIKTIRGVGYMWAKECVEK